MTGLDFTPANGKHLDLAEGCYVTIFSHKLKQALAVSIVSVKQLGYITLYQGVDDSGLLHKFTNEVILGGI
jgi:hypothetical protein